MTGRPLGSSLVSSNLFQFFHLARKCEQIFLKNIIFIYPLITSNVNITDVRKVNKKSTKFVDIALLNLFVPNVLGNYFFGQLGSDALLPEGEPT